MKSLSHQAVLVQAAWNDVLSRRDIEAKMVSLADDVLSYEIKTYAGDRDLYTTPFNVLEQYEWSERAYSLLFNDGLFDPFFEPETVRCAAYKDYVEEHGNEEDEAEFLTCYWITALTNADAAKFMPVIRKLMDIMVNGL